MTYKRIMLKLSGEALTKPGKFGLDHSVLMDVAKSIKKVHEKDIEVVIVVGGGNIWRWRDTEDKEIERTASDAMGMLATIMNSVGLQSALESIGCFTRVASAVNVPQLAEPYLRRRALRHLEKGRVVICAGGTGNPYFTTDSAAALRALELNCDVLLKATNVKGVYDCDPKKSAKAKLYTDITFREVLEKHLNVMDQAAFSLCQDKGLPIRVFDYTVKDHLLKAAMGENIGTLIHS